MIPFVNRLLEAAYRRRGARQEHVPFEGASLRCWRFDALASEAVEAAPSLLLVHGLGDTGLTWARVVPRLARWAPLHVLDLPSFGGSTLPEAARERGYCTIEEQCRAVTRAVDHASEEGARRVLVVAHSLGAWAGLRAASRSLEGWAGLVAVSGSGVRYEGMEDLARLREATTRERVLEVWQDMWHRVPRFLPRFADDVAQNMKCPAIRGLIDSVSEGDLVEPEAIPRGLRLWVVWGESDRLVPVAAGRRLSEATGAPLVVLPGAGHVPQVEVPDLLAAAIGKAWREATGDVAEGGPSAML